jgi:hypothetical protein
VCLLDSFLLTSSLETSHDHLHAVSYPPLSKNPYDPGCNNHIFRKIHPSPEYDAYFLGFRV